MISLQLNAAPANTKKGYPQIVVCGESREKITYHYIRLENLVFPVSWTMIALANFENTSIDYFNIINTMQDIVLLSNKNISFLDIQFKVPESFNFVQTFDLFFKVHKVFNQSFEPSLVCMLTFVQHAIFSMPEDGVIPTPRMNEVLNMLK